MGFLYFFETTMDFHGTNSQEHIDTCLSTYKAFTESHLGQTEGGIRQLWKIPGEHKLIGVVSVDSPGELDTLINFTLKRSLGDKISTVFTPLRPYQDFAATVGATDKTPVECAPKAGLHYLLTATVEYQGMSQEELFKIWSEEATAALDAKKSGTILDLWKVVAQRKVIVIICVDDPGDLDQISFDLPIMKKMGDQVHITCKSIRHVTEWIDELKKQIE
ncbi:hypothetical protein OS493_005463 [Desmophyllum pertusum]|uniref:Muconolactone isomerase domain-containing protein n=1 Tax=Desmophyllum pertusum TaxID=174260 RepID=A0A9W9YSC3_9CNID|nr:hypothetical protein OS493_005463 [Desmophyllum pertusum]